MRHEKKSQVRHQRGDRLNAPQNEPGSVPERGALLLYVTLVIALVSIGAAAVMPVMGSILNQSTERDASDQMQELAEAMSRYYEDMQEFPDSLFDLIIKPDGAENWLGGYIRTRSTDDKNASLSLVVDVWHSPYQLIAVDSWTRKVVSFGPNGADDHEGGDDIVVTFTVHHNKWELTAIELEEINEAIAEYNTFEDVPLMSSAWPSILAALEVGGYIETGSAPNYDYMNDAWGQTYVPVGDPVYAANTVGQPASY